MMACRINFTFWLNSFRFKCLINIGSLERFIYSVASSPYSTNHIRQAWGLTGWVVVGLTFAILPLLSFSTLPDGWGGRLLDTCGGFLKKG